MLKNKYVIAAGVWLFLLLAVVFNGSMYGNSTPEAAIKTLETAFNKKDEKALQKIMSDEEYKYLKSMAKLDSGATVFDEMGMYGNTKDTKIHFIIDNVEIEDDKAKIMFFEIDENSKDNKKIMYDHLTFSKESKGWVIE